METRILAHTGATLAITFYDANGAPVDADGPVTATVTAADGTVVATGAATHGATASGVYTFPLAPQELNLLRTTWTGTFGGAVQTQYTDAEIVGGFHVSVAEMRAQPNLADTAKFPAAALISARNWWESLAESYCDRAFVPRYRRITVWGSGDQTLQLPDVAIRLIRSLSWGTISLSTLALANLAVDASGLVSRWWPYPSNLSEDFEGGWFNRFPPRARITVAYEHGLDAPPPHLHDAALIAIRSKLLNDQVGRPMLSVSDGAGGTTRFAMPGPGRPTGIPDVDAVLNDPNLNLSDRFNVGSTAT